MKKTSIFSTRHSIFHIFLVLCILGLFIGGSAAVLKNMTMEAVAADNSQLSYHSISVSMGDTLWSVAKDNYTEEWGSLSVYLKEIKRCNALASEEITAGSSLIVPIYLPSKSANANYGMELPR